MANIDGLPVNSAVTHAEFMSRTQDTSTVSKIGLLDPDVASGASISNVQKAINKAFEGVGTTGESDTAINDYASNNYILDGDDRKEAIEKLDAQLGTTQAQLTALDAINSQDVSLGAIGTTPNANGSTITGQVLNLEPANASFGGVVTTGAQTFAGDKTFQNNVVVTGDLTVNGTTTTVNSTTVSTADKNITISQGGNDAASEGAGLTVDRTSADGSFIYKDASATKWAAGSIGSEVDVVGTTSTQALTNKTIDGASNTITNISGAALTGTVPIASGGTGQTTQTAAFDALSPLTTKGDLITHNNTDNIRIGVGSDGQVLTADSAEAGGFKWSTLASGSNYDSSLSIQNLGISTSIGSNALTINITQKDGTTPSTGSAAVKIGVRNSSLTSGEFSLREVTSALSFVVSSGSTLGFYNGLTHFIYVYLIDNAGTLELAVSQTLFDETKLVTTTAEGGAGTADSNAVMYSATARASVAFRCVGRLTSSQATAGTWITAVSNIALGDYSRFSKSDDVMAMYSSSSGQSLTTNTFTVINFGTIVKDTKGLVGTGTWVFTASEAGDYRITAALRFSGSTAASNTVMRVNKNGSTVRVLVDTFVASNAVAQVIGLTGTTTVTCAVGDTLKLEAYQSTGGNLSIIADALYNYVIIQKVG